MQILVFLSLRENRISDHEKLGFRFSSVLVKNRGFGSGSKNRANPTHNAYVWNCYRRCLFFYSSVTVFTVLRTCIAQIARFASFDRDSCLVDQKTLPTSFSGCEQKYTFCYFSQKTRNSPFPQCKTSIGNNSGSIEDRVACIIGFSAMADQMAWLPSLSRDRKQLDVLRISYNFISRFCILLVTGFVVFNAK